jgi:exodeoxyribonuclease VII small subunit
MPPKKEPSFEDSLKRLEAIAREIEEGRIGLEESIARYEEGMKLVLDCRRILTQAEQRIRMLQPTPDGDLETRPFEPGDDAEVADDADG